MATAESTHKRAPDVITTDLGDELVLLDPRDGEMFGLNAAGRRIWLALDDANTYGLVNLLCAQYRIAPARARVDLERLLAELVDAGLVESYDAPS